MNVDLAKDDLISLVKGSSPSYRLINEISAKNYGRFSDINGWTWDDTSLSTLSELELYNLYMFCKLSWQ